MNVVNEKRKALLPYEIIVAATEGNIDAINTVLNHYRAYITILSMRYLYDEFGNKYEYVDEEKRQMLEIQMITGILHFRTDQIV